MNRDIVTGKSQNHLTKLLPSEKLIHKDAAAAFQSLQIACQSEGFDLQIISSFRDYQRQLTIWNHKANGKRQLNDDEGNPLELEKLSPREVVDAITRWSAVPGFSRHHWGTDLDIYDAKALAADKVQLMPKESEPGGPFYGLHQFLDQLISENGSFGFYRPYQEDLGGVSPERWHLSFAPIAEQYLQLWNRDLFEEVIQSSDMELKEVILEDLDHYFDRCIRRITSPPFPYHTP